MSDDPDLTSLASAYLDEQASSDERATVEADSELLAEVERLGSVRAALLDGDGFESPAAGVREAAIAAALAAWEATSASVPAARGVRFERRWWSSPRWLAAAAAVVAVAAFGVVVAQLAGDRDNDDSSAVEAPADEAADTREGAATEPLEAPAATDAVMLDATAEEAAGVGTDPDAAAPPAEVPGAAPSGPAEATELAASADLETPADLGAYAVAAAQRGDQAADVLARPCIAAEFDDIDEYVATGTYRGVPIVVGVDIETRRAFGIDPDTCEVVAEASMP